MKFFLVFALLLSANLMASPKCQDIRVTDLCTQTESGIFIKAFETTLVCETEDNKDHKRTVKFRSLTSAMDCHQFSAKVSTHDFTLSQLDALIDYSSPISKAKIKTIGSDLPSFEERTQQRIQWLRQATAPKKHRTSSLREAMKHRRQ